MKNEKLTVNNLTDFLLDQIERLASNELTPEAANAIANLSALVYNRPLHTRLKTETMTMREACDFLGIDADRLDDLEREGRLHSFFLDGEQTFDKSELTTIAHESRYPTPPTIDEVEAYCDKKAIIADAKQFIDYYKKNCCKFGSCLLNDWKKVLQVWYYSDIL